MMVNDDVKEAVKKGKILIGTKSVMRGLKRGEVGLVVYASNTPEGFRSDMERCAGISRAEVKGFNGDSSKLGGLCGKPFNILTVGIRK